jgi:hypothetical protein
MNEARTMNTEWINENLDYLEAELAPYCPIEKTAEYDPSTRLYNDLFHAGDFTYFVRQLCEHIRLPTVPEIEVVGDSDMPRLDLQAGLRFFEKEIDSAGDYSSRVPFKPKIRVGASHLRKPRTFAHICAHELAHHFMRYRFIKAPTEGQDEMLTDLTAVYLGFGKLMLNGAVDAKAASVGEPIHLSDKGVAYLGYPLLSYVYYICQIKRGAATRNIYSHLEPPCVQMVKAFAHAHGKRRSWWSSVLELLTAHIAPRLPETDGTDIYQGAWRLDERRYRIAVCPGCGVKIKIPKSDKNLEVRCPKCRKEFLVGTRYI